MPRGRHLTVDERRIILNLHDMTDMTSTEIGAVVNRVRGSVHNVIKNLHKQRPDPRSGRPPKVSEQAKRSLLRNARTGKYTIRQILSEIDAEIRLSRARQIVSADE